MFSLFIEINFRHAGQVILFPLSVAVSKFFIVLNETGDRNHFLHCSHHISTFGISLPFLYLTFGGWEDRRQIAALCSHQEPI